MVAMVRRQWQLLVQREASPAAVVAAAVHQDTLELRRRAEQEAVALSS